MWDITLSIIVQLIKLEVICVFSSSYKSHIQPFTKSCQFYLQSISYITSFSDLFVIISSLDS